MSQKAKDLKRLQSVATLALDTELARLSDIKREEAPIRERLKQLEEARMLRQAQIKQNGDFDLASLMGVDRNWEAWADQQKRQAMMELSQVAERREKQLEKTRKAFGKKDALGRLAERFVNSKGG